MIDKLAEDEGFVIVVEKFGDDASEDFEFAAGNGDFGFDQLSVAAGPTKAHDFSKHLQMLLSGGGVAFFELGNDFSAQGFVENHFFFAKFSVQYDFGAGWKLLQDLRFGATEDEGLNEFSQTIAYFFIKTFFDRVRVTLVKLIQ